jgi:hypothetical protein
MAVRGRTHGRLGTDVAASTRSVLDDELLTKPLREPLTQQARNDVLAAPRRLADDDAHWPHRIGLR